MPSSASCYAAPRPLANYAAVPSVLDGLGVPTQTTLPRSGLGVSSSDAKLDQLAAPKVETPAQPEAFFGGIEDEAGSLFGLLSRLITRLARLFDTTRFERRALETNRLGILSTTGL